MPFIDGEWVDPEDEEGEGSVSTAEEDKPEPEEPEQEEPQSDIGEYIRRAKVQSALFGNGGLPSEIPENEAQGPNPSAYVTPAQSVYQPGPRMQEFKKAIEEMPLRQDYRPSGLRKGLGIAAGIAEGIHTANPAAGSETREAITNKPYTRNLTNYQQMLNQKGQLAQMEAGGNQAARQYYLDLAKIQQEQETARGRTAYQKSQQALAEYRRFQTSPEYFQHQLDLAAAKRAPGAIAAPWDVVDVTGKHHVASLAPGGVFKDIETGAIIPSSQIDPSKTKKVGAPVGSQGTLHPVQGPNGQVTWQTTENAVGKPAPKGADEIAAAQRNSELQAERNQSHYDKSYQFHTQELDKLQKPLSDYTARLSRLEDTLHSGNIVGDTLFGPELLSVMAGGPGSGVRMNEAELNRIFGSRTAEDSFKVWLSKLSTDPKNAEAISPAQRQQADALLRIVRQKINDKNAALSEAGNSILASKDENGHRTALNTVKQKLAAIDAGTGGAPTTPSGLPKPGEMFQGQKVLKVTEIHK